MTDNRSKLINVSPTAWARLNSQIERPIQPQRIAELVVSVEPTREGADAEREESLFEWIERIEAAKGPAARRGAFERALKDPHVAQSRDQLIREAAKIEVRATLDKVDALKTVSAKRRYLLDALEALRADSASDELQRPQIDALETTLKGLDGI